MNCTECFIATGNRLHAIFRGDCSGCRARAIAAGPVFFEARYSAKGDADYRAKRDAYRDLLAKAGVQHSDVMRWASPEREARGGNACADSATTTTEGVTTP